MKYVVYYRVSTRKQGDSGLGLEAQRNYIRHFLSPESIAGEFTDVQSGKSADDRPELQKALEMAREKSCGLAVAKLDRLSRNTQDALAILEELDGHLFACDLPTQPGQPADKFMLTLVAAMAERERELASIRTKQALDAKRGREGEWRVGGITKEQAHNGGRATQENARRAYQTVLGYIELLRREIGGRQGLSLQAIADRLNSEGHRTRTGKQFRAVTVKRILDRAA